MTEYGGIVYIASYNPETLSCEIGSFPSPQRDFSTNDFGEIGPVNFTTAMYTVNTGTPVKENLSVVRKLFEPEILTLHPGDMYLIEYTINTPSGDPTAPDTINSELKYENYISKDVTNRKLFRLKFYKIASSNSLTELDESNVNVVPEAPDIDLDSEYKYFTEPSSAVLAASLELETMDLFQVSVVDASLRTDSDKKVAIEAIGSSASLADFQGVKVDVTLPSTFSTYLDKGSNMTKKVSGVIDGLSANDDFQCVVTPYSKYMLFTSLQQNFKFTLGKYLTSGSGVNNLFRYYVDPSYIKIDFDYTFQGNSPSGPHLYIEFYDPWSDYSVIKRVDNPTFYGINSVIVETVVEPLIDQFDSTTVGGTAPNQLITNSDTVYETTLLNSTSKIRTTQVLRLNTFYIVRISGADPVVSGSTVTYNHYDFIKGMYTTPMFNDIYTAQNGLLTTDPAYVADFNQLDFDIAAIGYESTVTQTSSTSSTPVTVDTPNALMTNGQFYYVNATKNTSFTNYLDAKTYTTETDYSVALTLEGVDQVFGTFKTNLVGVVLPTLVNSGASGGTAATVVDGGYDNNTNIPPNSLASWTITSVGSTIYNVTTKLVTVRNIYAPVAYDNSKTGTSYKEVPLTQSLLCRPNADSTLVNSYAGMQFDRHNQFGAIHDHASTLRYYDTSGAIQTVTVLQAMDDPQLYTELVTNLTKKYSGFWGGFTDPAPDRWYAPGTPGVWGGSFNSSGSTRENVLFLSNGAGGVFATRTTTFQGAKSFFDNVLVASNVSTNLWLHYADGNAIQSNGQIVTTATFANAPVTTTLTPDMSGGVYIKTYLSNFRFTGNGGTIQEFNPTVINTYITARMTTSTIVDGKSSVRDGFIPYIDAQSSSVFDLSFANIVIDQAPDANILQNVQQAKSIGWQDPVYTTAGNYKQHGTLFSTSPDFYTDMLPKFDLHNVTAGVEVDPSTVYITVKPGEATITGYYAQGGSPKADNAPNVYLDFVMAPIT
jgi:hypothetical protein